MYIYEKMNNGAYILHYSFFHCVTCYTPQGKKIRALPRNLTNKTDTRQPRDFVSLVARKSQRVIVVWMVLFPKGCAKHKTSRPPFFFSQRRNKTGGHAFSSKPPPMSVAESVSPDGLVVGAFPHVLVDVLPIVLVGCYPDGRGCRKDGEMFDLEHAHSGLDIFLLHDAVLLHLMITFIVLLPRFTMLMPRCGVERRLPFRS